MIKETVGSLGYKGEQGKTRMTHNPTSGRGFLSIWEGGSRLGGGSCVKEDRR